MRRDIVVTTLLALLWTVTVQCAKGVTLKNAALTCLLVGDSVCGSLKGFPSETGRPVGASWNEKPFAKAEDALGGGSLPFQASAASISSPQVSIFKRGLMDTQWGEKPSFDMGWYDPNKNAGLMGCILAPFKALGQAIDGDNEGAEEVADKWTKEMPLVSQFRATVEAAMGNTDAAKRTSEHFASNLKDASIELGENFPVVGHIVGVVYYATGNTEGGNRCMEGATKAFVVVVAGAVGGPGGGKFLNFKSLMVNFPYFSGGCQRWL